MEKKEIAAKLKALRNNISEWLKTAKDFGDDIPAIDGCVLI